MRVFIFAVTLIMVLVAGCGQQGDGQINEEQQRSIDFEQVRWFAKRAQAAYQSQAQIKQAFPNSVHIHELEGINVQYFIEREPNADLQVVTIRGTANLSNIREDAEYAASKNQRLGIFVHSGFDEDASIVYQDMLPHINKQQAVAVTGHSLGAAIATLIMMYLHEDGYTVAPSINFGQPKVTNAKGVERYNFLPLMRVKDKNDVVPDLPPADFIDMVHGSYQHLGVELILLDNAYYVYRTKHQTSKHSLDSFWNNLGDQSLEAHKMVNYLKNIVTKVERAEQIPYSDAESHES